MKKRESKKNWKQGGGSTGFIGLLVGAILLILVIVIVDWGYLSHLVKLFGSATRELISTEQEATDKLMEEMDNLTIDKFLRLPFEENE